MMGDATFRPALLEDLVQFSSGKSINPGGEGIYPVYGANGIIGASDDHLYEGAIILGRVGAYCGSVAYCPSKFWASDNTIIVEPRPDRVDTQYVYYLLKDANLNRHAGGAAQPLLTQSRLKPLEFSLPPLPIQRRIAAILSAYDDLIENNTHRIAILEEMARRLYEEWFVYFRFPGHEGVKMVESEIGEMPEGWEVKSLGDLVDTQYGYTETTQNEVVGPKFLRGTDINKQPYIDWTSVPYCPIDDERFEKFRLREGDILVIRMADPGKIGIVEEPVEAVFASYLVRLTISSDLLDPYFLFYFLTGDRYQGYITGASTGTTRKSASAAVLVGVEILLPPAPLRKLFRDQVKSLRQLLNRLLKKNANRWVMSRSYSAFSRAETSPSWLTKACASISIM